MDRSPAPAPGGPTFVVKRYWPGVSAADAEDVAARELRAAAEMRSECRVVHVVRTTFVEKDETLLTVVRARSEHDVAALAERAGRPADRIVRAYDVGASESSARERATPGPAR